MTVMEGMLLVPPERGSIIGRASWKTRYVVFGHRPQLQAQTDTFSTSSRKSLRASSTKASQVNVAHAVPDRLYVTMYKAKGDIEYIARHPIHAFTSCEVRNVAYRKQSASVPTLLLAFKPDESTDKQRKRRSSRAGTINASKDPWADMLLFRTLPEERFSIFDWQLLLKPRLNYMDPGDSPLSPPPESVGFTNPFAVKEEEMAPTSAGRLIKAHTSDHTRAQRQMPSTLISPSPSLRSRRSDLSSQNSSQLPPPGFTSNHAHSFIPSASADMPSPASTFHDNHFPEGSISAQGRCSALSTHTRGSNSIASAASPNAILASTPPGPRETILDRAFQLRCIPGSELQDHDDEKMSSMARFEALMKEQDQRRLQKAVLNQKVMERSTWEVDEESDAAEEGSDEDPEDPGRSDHEIEMSTPAQRALAYISGRETQPHKLSPGPTTPPIPFLHQQGINVLQSYIPSSHAELRPRTGSSQKRKSRPTSLCITSRSMSEHAIAGLTESNSNVKLAENRRSSASIRAMNVNFQEYTERFSSTSNSLLPTNTSSAPLRDASCRDHADFGGPLGETWNVGEDDGIIMSSGSSSRTKRNSINTRGSTNVRGAEKKCGWKSKIHMFGEGTFI